MLRFELGELGAVPLPPLDLTDPVVIVGSSPAAQVRLPAAVAREVHVRIEAGRWVAIGELLVDGVRRAAGEGGTLGAGALFELGTYRVRVQPSPGGTVASPPQRTESLARELVRSLLGSDAAPAFEIEIGPAAGQMRTLPPPEARVVVGRGDDADWVILDEELSRAHAEVRRGWDGVTIRDLESKNGTRVEGAVVGDKPVELHDGARVELGDVVLRFRDPAERHLRGEPSVAPTAPAPTVVTAPPPAAATRAAPREDAPGSGPNLPLLIALVIGALAVSGLVWILAS